MGNVAIGAGRRPEVEERLTQPRRLLRQLCDVDSGRLRRLIRSGDLAPCFDPAEDAAGLDEDCPICFYFYPSLNRSKCCGKEICTAEHCCPFCKTASYAVEYRGNRAKREKKLDQQEEQKASEPKKKIQYKSQTADELKGV
uniref:RING-type domain-containing protein n=1 Tax=Oryza punctata TaxID=4537 RepID=A0A0E0LE55_ORYPU